ncbi:unnamed protein product, partial [Ectocarpus sp. 12 AP-2014]
EPRGSVQRYEGPKAVFHEASLTVTFVQGGCVLTMGLLPSTPSTPPLITNHSSHRQSSIHPINTIHPCLAKAAKPPAPLPTHRPP